MNNVGSMSKKEQAGNDRNFWITAAICSPMLVYLAVGRKGLLWNVVFIMLALFGIISVAALAPGNASKKARA
jgi:hypothetical protein